MFEGEGRPLIHLDVFATHLHGGLDTTTQVSSKYGKKYNELYLETDVDVGPVDGGRPPEGEAPVGDLVETGALGVRQLLVLHRLLEAGRLLPEETLPRGEIGALQKNLLLVH